MKHVHRTIAGLAIAFLLAAAPGLAAEAKPEGTKRVNINTADSSQLSMLPRVGPSVADRIVEYRKENGPFKKPEDLMLVQGIGEKTFQVIKPYVAVSGETTLKEKASSGRSGKGGKGKSSRAKSGKAAKEKSAPDGAARAARASAQGKPAHSAARATLGQAARKTAKATKATKARPAQRKSGADVG